MDSQKGLTFAADFSIIMHSRTHIHLISLLMTTCAAIACLLAGCSERRLASDLLAEAEQMYAIYPDSSKTYTDLLQAAMQQAEQEKSSASMARCALLLARQQQWTDVHAAYHLAARALQLYEEMSDETGKIQAQLTMAGLLAQADSLAQARSLYHTCLQSARQLRDAAVQRSALAGMAELCLAEGKNAEALATARQIPFIEGEEGSSQALFVLANCYLQCDSLAQARAIYGQIDTRGNTKARYVALRHLTEIALLEGDLEGAPLYVDSAFATAEELFFETLQQQEQYHRDNLRQQREAERIAYRHRLIFGLLAGTIVFAGLVIAYVVSLSRHRRAIQHQRLLAEQRERELAEERLMGEKRERELAVERLQRQEQMVSLLQGFIIEKSEILQRLQGESDRKVTLSNRDWREIEETLDSITGGFVSRLRQQHPEFHEEDIQLCMMTRMRLSNQAIARIYLITVSAVKHRKLKLKKDGFGEFDPNRPLDDVINEL